MGTEYERRTRKLDERDADISDRSSDQPQPDPDSDVNSGDVNSGNESSHCGEPPGCIRKLLLSSDSNAEFDVEGSESDSSAGQIGQKCKDSPSSERTLIMGELT